MSPRPQSSAGAGAGNCFFQAPGSPALREKVCKRLDVSLLWQLCAWWGVLCQVGVAVACACRCVFVVLHELLVLCIGVHLWGCCVCSAALWCAFVVFRVFVVLCACVFVVLHAGMYLWCSVCGVCGMYLWYCAYLCVVCICDAAH